MSIEERVEKLVESVKDGDNVSVCAISMNYNTGAFSAGFSLADEADFVDMLKGIIDSPDENQSIMGLSSVTTAFGYICSKYDDDTYDEILKQVDFIRYQIIK